MKMQLLISVAVATVAMVLVCLVAPSQAIPNPCQYCAFCSHCDKCEQCPCSHVKECSLCKYCSYCSLCSMCSSACGEGGIIDSASSLVNRVVQLLGLESEPDFKEVNKDIAGLDKRFTKGYAAEKRELAKKLAAQKAAQKKEETAVKEEL